MEKDKKKIRDHIAAIHILKENGLKGSGVIRAYHARRVAPLVTRALPLYVMAPEASFDGTVVTEGGALKLRDCATHQGGNGALMG